MTRNPHVWHSDTNNSFQQRCLKTQQLLRHVLQHESWDLISVLIRNACIRGTVDRKGERLGGSVAVGPAGWLYDWVA